MNAWVRGKLNYVMHVGLIIYIHPNVYYIISFWSNTSFFFFLEIQLFLEPVVHRHDDQAWVDLVRRVFLM